MKHFNITGICHPDNCFMVDTKNKIDQILEMVYKKSYFVINRPRQYGKTTTMFLLEQRLLQSDEYLPIFTSFESLDNSSFETPEKFTKKFLKILGDDFYVEQKGYSDLFHNNIAHVEDFDTLSKVLRQILNQIDKKIVLMIDEVDKSSDNQIFLHFLGMLREKYLNAQINKDVTFHSVILAGVHDIKNLKLKIRPDEEKKLNSPWNIAVNFDIDMSFSAPEIQSMLIDYSDAKNIQMDIVAISERIYFWTSGYPFLVSKLCKMIDEGLLPKRENKNWDVNDIDSVVNLLLNETNTIFDDIAKNLENNKDLFLFINSVVFGLNDFNFTQDDNNINRAFMFGLIDKTEENKIKIHNKIFEERITNYFISKAKTSRTNGINPINTPYIKETGLLDFAKILDKFQETIREKYSKTDALKSDEFLENDLRLLFLMFLKPILNGYGFCFKEVQTGAEKRLDIVVVFKNEKFIVELKLWKGEEAHQDGIQQLKDYMKAEAVEKGYMLIMNKNKKKKFKNWIEEGIYCVMI